MAHYYKRLEPSDAVVLRRDLALPIKGKSNNVNVNESGACAEIDKQPEWWVATPVERARYVRGGVVVDGTAYHNTCYASSSTTEEVKV